MNFELKRSERQIVFRLTFLKYKLSIKLTIHMIHRINLERKAFLILMKGFLRLNRRIKSSFLVIKLCKNQFLKLPLL